MPVKELAFAKPGKGDGGGVGPGFWEPGVGPWEADRSNLPSLSARCPALQADELELLSQKAFSVTTLVVSLTSFVQWNLRSLLGWSSCPVGSL